MLQGFAVEELHRNEMLAFLLADVVNGADVRVIQCGCSLRFSAEPFQRSGVVEHFGGQEFQAHRTMEPGVFGFIDNTHPTTTELFYDSVM
jgi:hypothetical protein